MRSPAIFKPRSVGSDTAAVRLEHLSKTYRGGVPAVDDLNVGIAHGEFVCILGPSGSGKSTVLKLIAGIEESSGGRIFFDDQEVTRTTPERRDVAMVFQSYGLYPHMTVGDNIAFPLMLRGMSKRERMARSEEVAELLGIGRLLKRYPKQLSGGERQRVALGRAIVRQPRVFLLDEPLSNLDANLRVAMRQELRRLHELLGATFIYVTHDQDDALTMGERVLVMAAGKLQQFGSALDVYHSPANRFVASFLGRAPMNFFTGTLQHDGGRLLFRNQTLSIAVPDPGGIDLPAEKEVTLGIRPDAVWARSDSTGQGMMGSVRWIELVQPDLYATVSVGEHSILARMPEGEPIEVGQTVELTFAPDRLHVFDTAGGERLFKPAEPAQIPAAQAAVVG